MEWVVVFDLSDLAKTGKANSFIRLWLRQVGSLLCQLRKAILIVFEPASRSNNSLLQQQSHCIRTRVLTRLRQTSTIRVNWTAIDL
jgi:hypothetical protein